MREDRNRRYLFKESKQKKKNISGYLSCLFYKGKMHINRIGIDD